MYQEIDSYELLDIMKSKKINLIDIRDSYIYSLGTITGAKNIPLNYLRVPNCITLWLLYYNSFSFKRKR